MKPSRPSLALVAALAVAVSVAPSASALGAPRERTAGMGSATLTPRAPRTAPSTRSLANRVIVRLKGAVTSDALASLYASAETSAGAVRAVRGDILSWRVPDGETAEQFAALLEDTGRVAYAEPNYVRQLAGYNPPSFVEPNDPAYTDTDVWGYKDSGGNWTELYPHAKSWWLRDISGIAAWRRAYTGSDVSGKYPLRATGDAFTVGVIDTGIYLNHPDRSAYMVAGSADATPVDPSRGPYPNNTGANVAKNIAEVSHGTCVAGIVGAAVGNGVGTLGIANDTRVAAYKVYFGGSGIEDSDIVTALRQAADDGCKVLNMSIAGGPYSQALQDAIDYAWNRGCVIVAATGNDGAASVSYPAAMDHVLAVGALGHDGNGRLVRADYSNYGSKLDISAPGSWVWGLTMPGYTEDSDSEPGYKWWDGTSMASPAVAGGIALLWRAAPWMSNSEIIALAQNTAEDLGASGKDASYGYGDFDVANAYDRLISDYPLLGTPSITVVTATDAADVRIRWSDVPGYKITYDVALDGTRIARSLSTTSLTLPRMTSAQHVISVTAKSTRNWSDSKATDSVTIHPAVPLARVTSLRYYRGKLLWTDSEKGRVHTDRISIDGEPTQIVVGESLSTAALAIGPHIAVLTVQSEAGLESPPTSLTFTVRPAPSVRRITATDRYGYAAALSRSVFTTAATAVVVGGASWPDAFAAAPLAHLVGGPVLASSSTVLPAATKTELARLGVTSVIIVGSTGDVADSVRSYLQGRGMSTSRVGGADRYATADAVAREIAARSPGAVVPEGRIVVVGDSYSSALAASAVAAREGWPLLYARSKSVPASTRTTIADLGATNSLVVGSSAMVSSAAAATLPTATRITAATSLGIPPALATWATASFSPTFSGERVYVVGSSDWKATLGLPAASAEKGDVVLASAPSLSTQVRGYYVSNSEVAVTTRIVGSVKTISSASVTAIKRIVGAQ